MADEEEESVGRRLLEHLEQGVGAGRLELVDACRSPPRATATARRSAHELAEVANLIDGDVAGEVAASSRLRSRSSQRMSGWLPASTSLTIG